MGRVEVENDRHETALAINPLLDRNQLVVSDAVQAAAFSWHPCSLLSVTAVCSNTFLLFVELPQSLHGIAAWEAKMTSQSTDHHI